MAYVSQTLRPSLRERLLAAVQQYRVAAERRALFRQTVKELDALTDRDLADLGVARADIEDLAREHVYGER